MDEKTRKIGKQGTRQDGGDSGPAAEDDAADKKAETRKRLDEKFSRIRHKIMVISGKGGVGKSTVACNIAAALARRGYRVGILDADLHGPDVPKMLGIEDRKLTGIGGQIEPVEVFKGLTAVSMGLLGNSPDEAIAWRGPRKHGAIRQFMTDVNWGMLDYLVVDLPPGTGDEPLSVAKLIGNVDGAVVVTTPQGVALLDSRKAVSFSKMIELPVLGIVENMSGLVCPLCGGTIDLFKTGGGEKAAEELGVPFLARIPIDPQLVERCDSGELLLKEPGESAAKEAFEQLVRKLLDALESRDDGESATAGRISATVA